MARDWRKVNLFDLTPDTTNITKITDALDDGQVTCFTSGRGQNIICDSNGKIHVFDRNWDCISFRGYDISINFCVLSIKNNLLITIPKKQVVRESFKVWNLSKITKSYGAPCLRNVFSDLLQKPTALAVSDSGQMMAIGYDLGSVSLYRGDIGRDNAKTLKNLKCFKTAIVGIAFQEQGKIVNMFVCSDSGVVVYNIKSKEKETQIVLDDMSSPITCFTFQNNQEHNNQLNFVVGRNNAIYCFNVDGRGPCYVLDGQKSLVDWFITRLIVVSKNEKSTTDKQILSIIDMQDNIIVFNCIIDEVVAIFKEFETCNILTKNNELFSLCEKDLQSKLNILLKKNQYEVAIRIAGRQQNDAERHLAEIYKRYGDHLYLKRDYEGAVLRYIKTIGYVEPSYVTSKFFDSKNTKYLTDYLLELHRKDKTTSVHHITLLLKCLTKLDLKDELTDFLSKDRHPDIMFDMDIAIKICRNASVELALDLAKRNQKHDYCISILIEDMKDPEEALDYISKLSNDDAEKLLIKYGVTLMNYSPEKTTDILKKYCSSYESLNQLPNVYDIGNEYSKSFSPEKFLNAFYKNSDKLIEFIEYVLKNRPCSNSKDSKNQFLIVNTLIELYLRKWKNNDEIKNRLLEILQQGVLDYDMNHVLILCRLYNFVPGFVWIYEQNKLYHLVIQYHLENKNYEELQTFCERNGPSEPSLWLRVLSGLKNYDEAPPDLLISVLNHMHSGKEKFQSPLQNLNYLTMSDKSVKLSSVRRYFVNVLQKESEITNQKENKVIELLEKLKLLKTDMENIHSNPIEFRNTMCDECLQRLTMPAVYFLCKHSYHQECLRMCSDSEKDCKICHEAYSQLQSALTAQSESQNKHDDFHKTLIISEEPFSVVSKYFGHGFFNKIKLDDNNQLQPISHNDKPNALISEGKIRVTEGNTIKSFVSDTLTYRPKAEGRIRAEEAYKYGKIFNKKETVALPKKIIRKENSSKAVSTNPFYDEESNPFYEDSNETESSSQPRAIVKPIEQYNNIDPFA